MDVVCVCLCICVPLPDVVGLAPLLLSGGLGVRVSALVSLVGARAAVGNNQLYTHARTHALNHTQLIYSMYIQFC